jgi:thiamine kinase-like enzyme
MYEQILDRDVLGTALLYGASAGAAPWIVLEKVPGVELYQVGDLDRWCATARWLAFLHDRFSVRVPELVASGVPLLRHDAAYYRRWIERARTFRGGPVLDRIAQRYDDIVDRLVSMPVTLLHGECYASNVVVADARVCAIDWEMAALGPALIDLAALVVGSSWDVSDHDRLVRAYLGVAPDDAFAASLDVCRLQLAVQWLGWAQHWSAPQEHAHDWLAEARDAAERLDLC